MTNFRTYAVVTSLPGVHDALFKALFKGPIFPHGCARIFLIDAGPCAAGLPRTLYQPNVCTIVGMSVDNHNHVSPK